MQHLVAPVSINALHTVEITLVGNIVPCSDPMMTSSIWLTLSLLYALATCIMDCPTVSKVFSNAVVSKVI